jgi:polyhydroxyalkanoate synthase
MVLLSQAADHELPISSIVAVGSPFDYRQIPLAAPMFWLTELTGGYLAEPIYKILGSAPAPLVKRVFQLTSFDRYLTRPIAVLGHLDDRDFLAQVEAVDRLMNSMHAYPGRSIGQMYHRFFRVNDLADGFLKLAGRKIELANVDVPVLAIAGEHDAIAPRAAVHHVASVLTGSPFVRLKLAPGGHVGVLAGRHARQHTWAYIDQFLSTTVAPVARAPAQQH